jgi:hypothetical protein
MLAPPFWRRRWRNDAFPFRQIRRRRRQPSEHRRERSEQSNSGRRSERSEQSNTARYARAAERIVHLFTNILKWRCLNQI